MIAAASIAAIILPSVSHARCGVDTGFRLRDGGVERSVSRLGSGLAFTSGLKVNTDGAANSYHPVGRSRGALNTICNGIAVIPRTGPYAGQRVTGKHENRAEAARRCQLILDIFRRSRDANYAIPTDASIDWYALAMRDPEGGRYRPCIQERGQYVGFFVAQTARAADPSLDICDPAHWISSTAIPYVTLPGQRLAAHGATVGDVALVFRRHRGVGYLVVAVAGDTGNVNELGEGSIALHTALGNPSAGAIPNNIADGVVTVLFPRRRANRPITDASLQAERQALLREIGGQEAIAACAN